MFKIYILDDARDFRSGLRREIEKLNPAVTVIEFGNGDDAKFTTGLIQACSDRADGEQICPIIDVRMNITWDPWIKKKNKDTTPQDKRYWVVEFEAAIAHGFNIYNAIREKCGLIKIATISATSGHDLKTIRDGKPIPEQNEFYRHIHRNKSDKDIALELQAFFGF